MMLRVYALYGKNRGVLALLVVTFLAQIAVQSVVLAKSFGELGHLS
jgi:hypothetical protein